MRDRASGILTRLVKTRADLAPLLEDSDWEVRRAAVRMLHLVKGTLADLRPLLADRVEAVRQAARDVLPYATPALPDVQALLMDHSRSFANGQ